MEWYFNNKESYFLCHKATILLFEIFILKAKTPMCVKKNKCKSLQGE